MDNNNNYILNNRAFPQNGLLNKYKEFISTFGLNQLIRVPSRVTSNTSSLLDHVLTNASDKITQYGSLEISLSDHQPIFAPGKLLGLDQVLKSSKDHEVCVTIVKTY